ncbi:MAG: TIGR02452 family protein [Clostridia bacterium]|nr:TIGR02452 family protein [Clostridia bacterium]
MTNQIWDADNWKNQFQSASKTRDYTLLHDLRKAVFSDTLQWVTQSSYTSTNGNTVRFGNDAALQAGSILYSDEIKQRTWPQAKQPLVVEVIEGDTLQVAKLLVDQGENPAILNMANRQNPGGGVISGAGAQEEYLFRCSNYFRSLYQFARYATNYGLTHSMMQYPLDRNHGGVYSPGVTIFRGSEQSGYPLLDTPWKAAFIGVPAISNPDLTQDQEGKQWLSDSMAEGTKYKIRTIFRIALLHHHQSLVLGAFGCGAFNNPPHHMAQLFHQVLKEPEFAPCFEHIVFAILENHNSFKATNPEGNLKPFRDEFPC